MVTVKIKLFDGTFLSDLKIDGKYFILPRRIILKTHFLL